MNMTDMMPLADLAAWTASSMIYTKRLTACNRYFLAIFIT